MFAVFKTGGKQYRAAAEDVLKVDKIKGEPGEIVEFSEILVVGGDYLTLGAPTVAGATVAAEVLEQARGPKIIAFKKRRRKNSRRKRGHRQELSVIRITAILTEGAKPARIKSDAAPATEAAAEVPSTAPEAAPQAAAPTPEEAAPEAAAPAAKGKSTPAKKAAKK